MLALLFPGQGSQEVGMGRDVSNASRAAAEVYRRADEALGFSLSKVCFEGPEDELRRTEIQQPAILTTSIALLQVLEESNDVAAAYFAGHSLGEYTALVASGALPFEQGVRLVHARGRFMQEAVPEGRGAMAAVLGCTADEVEEACRAASRAERGVVQPANYNAPTQTVIAGDVAAVELAATEARRRGAKRVVPLSVSAPFHCPLMEPAAQRLEPELEAIDWKKPSAPIVSNVEATPNDDPARIPALLRQQVTAAVRFTESVQRLAELGVTRVLEVGPGSVLSGLVARIDRKLARANLSGADGLAEAGDFVSE